MRILLLTKFENHEIHFEYAPWKKDQKSKHKKCTMNKRSRNLGRRTSSTSTWHVTREQWQLLREPRACCQGGTRPGNWDTVSKSTYGEMVSPFNSQEMKAQRGEVTCQRSHCQEKMSKAELKSRTSDSNHFRDNPGQWFSRRGYFAPWGTSGTTQRHFGCYKLESAIVIQ